MATVLPPKAPIISREAEQRNDPPVVPPTANIQQPQLPRRSGRVRSEPDRYLGLAEVFHEETLVSDQSEPCTFKEAVVDENAPKWHKGMGSKFVSITDMDVYEKTELPDGCIAIDSKWVYKIKRDSNGKIVAFKARLVAKGYSQREGIGFDETFSPVAMIKSIRILLAISAHLDFEVWQMDVKTAFLHGYLEKGRDIYM